MAVLGILIGILTVLGQAYLNGNFNSIANSGTVWLLPAFFISSVNNKMRNSIFAGTASLFGMVIGYYGFEAIRNQHSFSVGYHMIIWLFCAVIGGIIFGAAGYLWRHKEQKFHSLGSALLSGIFLVDGLNMFIHFDDYKHMIPVPISEIILGLLLIILLERNNRERIKSCKVLIPIIVLGLAGYTALFCLTS